MRIRMPHINACKWAKAHTRWLSVYSNQPPSELITLKRDRYSSYSRNRKFSAAKIYLNGLLCALSSCKHHRKDSLTLWRQSHMISFNISQIAMIHQHQAMEQSTLQHQVSLRTKQRQICTVTKVTLVMVMLQWCAHQMERGVRAPNAPLMVCPNFYV